MARDPHSLSRASRVGAHDPLGTGIGGIIGPQLFGRLVPSGETSEVFLALAIGAVLMIIGGLAEIVFGVKAERRRLEGIAKPLTAVETAVRTGAVRTGAARAGTAARWAAQPRPVRPQTQ
jgi:hypothetical protein